ncbi:hypothetical protein CAPTEDRAFT_195248 [Capitella teleta]|uniref:Uncharacterized protein n=1 Tax=Capitella teleta TaxID=283909 RepID=R7TWL2_CAPTE|nr:hypothetical protein CAPTEDRAFT_195248 [Capitella teleta]|eukprot:ELT95801.1 hypothetical protein CAPTEDRAFT_195248 [Capitella teleta]
MLKGAWKITKESLVLTSLKGVPRIFKAQRTSLKALWIISVVKNAIEAYLEYKTVINNEEVFPKGLEMPSIVNQFPSLTFCNLKVIHHDTNHDFMSAVQYIEEVDRNNTMWKAAASNISADELNTLEFMKLIPAYYGFIGRKNAIIAGAQFDDFVKQCYIDTDTADYSIDCSQIGNFSQDSIPENFNCYSYRMDPGMETNYQPYKITFLLFVDSGDDFVSTDYTPESKNREAIGVKLALHSTTEPFDFKRKSMLLPPGHISAVNIDISQRHRLQAPYGQCTPNTPDAFFVQSGANAPYSRKACHAACVQANITEYCGCRDPSMAATYTLAETKLPFCSGPRETYAERMETSQCALLRTAAISTDCHKGCSQACQKLDVTPTLTTALWPRPSQQLGLYKTFIRGKTYADKFKEYESILQEFEKTGNETKALHSLNQFSSIQKNFVLVEVIRSQVGISIVADQVKTTPSDLVSTIGSLLNLYSGITVIILVEIIDYIFNMTVHFLCSKPDDEEENTKKESRRSSVPLESVNGGMSVRI